MFLRCGKSFSIFDLVQHSTAYSPRTFRAGHAQVDDLVLLLGGQVLNRGVGQHRGGRIRLREPLHNGYPTSQPSENVGNLATIWTVQLPLVSLPFQNSKIP